MRLASSISFRVYCRPRHAVSARFIIIRCTRSGVVSSRYVEVVEVYDAETVSSKSYKPVLWTKLLHDNRHNGDTVELGSDSVALITQSKILTRTCPGRFVCLNGVTVRWNKANVYAIFIQLEHSYCGFLRWITSCTHMLRRPIVSLHMGCVIYTREACCIGTVAFWRLFIVHYIYTTTHILRFVLWT